MTLSRYDSLKKQIYHLEKKQQTLLDQNVDLEAGEGAPLIGAPEATATDALFVPLLDLELRKISHFYEQQEHELLGEISEVERLVKAKEEEDMTANERYMDDGDDDDDDDDDDLRSPSHERPSIRGSSGRRAGSQRQTGTRRQRTTSGKSLSAYNTR